jgi:hypothetical protein
MSDEVIAILPAGYSLDLVGDSCIITLLRPNVSVVARFTRFADPQEIARAAEEDALAGGGRGNG